VDGDILQNCFDESYVNALRDRVPATEAHLVAAFGTPVRAKLYMRLRSPTLVEDGAQETFLRVFAFFRAGKTLDNPASLPGFVHSVCHNVALELLRSRSRYEQMPEDAPEPADTGNDPERNVAARETQVLIRQILDELPPRDRELLRRVFLEEEDKDRVCSDLRVDRGYLRVLLHRARLRFKAALLAGRGAASGDGETDRGRGALNK